MHVLWCAGSVVEYACVVVCWKCCGICMCCDVSEVLWHMHVLWCAGSVVEYAYVVACQKCCGICMCCDVLEVLWNMHVPADSKDVRPLLLFVHIPMLLLTIAVFAVSLITFICYHFR